jgi:glycosyltransferase involved in cell wall biosynthesis
MPMKIILAVNALSTFLSHRRGLYLKLKEEHSVGVIIPTVDLNAARNEIPSEDLLNLPLSRKGINPLVELTTLWAFFKLYREGKPDLVHHFTIKAVIYGTLAARWAQVPKIVNSITGLGYVFTANTLKTRILGFLVKNLYRFCLQGKNIRVIFQNQDDLDFFLNHKIVKREQCFLVEGSGVDTTKFTPNEPHNPHPKILIASRLLVEKGVGEFIDAIRILKKKNLNFEAFLAGDIDAGNPGSFSAETLASWKKENIIHFLGLQKDMVSLLKTADIACLPSYREGLPMSVLEAMAAGKPIVTTDAPGCRSTIKEGQNGILVPVKDAIALADALEKLILDKELRLRMGKASREIAVQYFSREKIISEIVKIYNT